MEIWKTLEISARYVGPGELEQELLRNGIVVGDRARLMLRKIDFPIDPIPRKANFTKLSLQSLGFMQRATYEEISRRGAELGLRKCMPEAAPMLRLEYRDQPVGEIALVMSEPIFAAGLLRIFSLVHKDRTLYLNGATGTPSSDWSPKSCAIFEVG